jgi:hypothetical protein
MVSGTVLVGRLPLSCMSDTCLVSATLAWGGARLVDVGDVDHNTSAELSVPQVPAFLTGAR